MGNKIISPYNKYNPIRIIDSINYVSDSSKSYCGQACIAMLTGIAFEEIIKLMRQDEHPQHVTKKVLKKWLDYYGINYALKSAKYDPNLPLPELCIIRMILPSGGGHWGLYFNGKYYDPDYGVLEECPQEVKIFQVWEIYSYPLYF